MDATSRLIAVARGQIPADLLLANARIVNVFTGEIEESDIAIAGGRIAGIGRGYRADRVLDLQSAFVAPGLIDAHVHIESSMCTPAEFAAAVVPRGVTTVVADPHEIANVAGIDGVRHMFQASRNLSLDVVLMAPSCVPATDMATSGGTLDARAIAALCDDNTIHGLGEMMNFPAAITGDGETLAKIAAVRGRPVDGHAPAVSGHNLNAYAAAGIGSDHECTSPAEAREKLSRGHYLLIREATNARNLDALLPVITPANSRRICLCTDDRTAPDLLREGSIDHMLRRAIASGLDPVDAIRMCTLNPAEWFGLPHIGTIAPGRLANLFVFDDLRQPTARMVFHRGMGAPPVSSPPAQAVPAIGKCVVPWDRLRWDIPATSNRIRVIGHRPDQLLTDPLILPAHILNNRAVPDVSNDILKMAVIERHRNTGNIGLGFIHGFGLKSGAIAGTVAHDHHNLIAIGADDLSMQSAARAAVSMSGGLAVAIGENIIATLPLPIGGLMSDRTVHEVAAAYDKVVAAARDLGSPLRDPFMAMSFMALEVIPSLKLTDQGLVDVEKFQFVPLFA